MIKFNFKSLLNDKEFKESRKIKYEEITKETGISRQTLSKIASVRGYKTNSDNIEKLCQYFDCNCDELMTFIPDKKE